jgi:cobalt-zinc-cadmium efflux system protein
VAGSAGVVVAGILVAAFGWNEADPVIALLVAALCIVSARGLIAEPVRILLERAPDNLDPEAIGRALCGVEGVREVHDVHAWTITSGFDAVSVHVIATPGTDQHALLHRLEEVLRTQFDVNHTTIQVDRDHSGPLAIHRKGCPEAPKPRTAAPRLHEHNH